MQYYVFTIDLFNSVIFVFGYGAFNILMGIKLPSLPVSVLYSHYSVLGIVLIFNLAVVIDWILWKLKNVELTMSDSSVDTFLS